MHPGHATLAHQASPCCFFTPPHPLAGRRTRNARSIPHIQVWKGTHKASEHALLDVPVALTSFVSDAAPPRLPALAVAAGGCVYIFRNLRPYYKFVVPARWVAVLAPWAASQRGMCTALLLRHRRAAAQQVLWGGSSRVLHHS